MPCLRSLISFAKDTRKINRSLKETISCFVPFATPFGHYLHGVEGRTTCSLVGSRMQVLNARFLVFGNSVVNLSKYYSVLFILVLVGARLY